MHFFATHLLFHNLRNVLAEFETPELDLNNPYSCNSEPHSPRKSRSFPHRGGATGLRACTEQHCLYPHTTLLCQTRHPWDTVIASPFRTQDPETEGADMIPELSIRYDH